MLRSGGLFTWPAYGGTLDIFMEWVQQVFAVPISILGHTLFEENGKESSSPSQEK